MWFWSRSKSKSWDGRPEEFSDSLSDWICKHGWQTDWLYLYTQQFITVWQLDSELLYIVVGSYVSVQPHTHTHTSSLSPAGWPISRGCTCSRLHHTPCNCTEKLHRHQQLMDDVLHLQPPSRHTLSPRVHNRTHTPHFWLHTVFQLHSLWGDTTSYSSLFEYCFHVRWNRKDL